MISNKYFIQIQAMMNNARPSRDIVKAMPQLWIQAYSSLNMIPVISNIQCFTGLYNQIRIGDSWRRHDLKIPGLPWWSTP